MAPPLFLDLGRNARDVFQRGYNFGFLKVDTNTRSGDIEFRTNCAQNISTGKFFGGVDVKYKIPQHGTTLTERWNTDNLLSTEVIIDDKLLKGFKLVLDSSYAPFVGKRSGRVRGEYRHDKATLNGEFKIDGTGGPIFNGAVVVGHQNWFLGYFTGFDPAKSKMTHSHIAIAAERGDFGFHSFVYNNNEFGGNIYHRVSKDLELAANMSWTTGEQQTRFGVATKYNLDQDTTVRTKINNSSQLAVALTHNLKPSLKATISANVNLQNINNDSHKLGFGLEYCP